MRDIPSRVLTPRELEVAGLVAEGLPYKEIAVALGISELTVRKHVALIGERISGPGRPRDRITRWWWTSWTSLDPPQNEY